MTGVTGCAILLRQSPLTQCRIRMACPHRICFDRSAQRKMDVGSCRKSHENCTKTVLCLFHRKYNIRVEDIMIRDVRYITLNCTYRDLHNVLLTGQLKTLALVETAGKHSHFIFVPVEFLHFNVITLMNTCP